MRLSKKRQAAELGIDAPAEGRAPKKPSDAAEARKHARELQKAYKRVQWTEEKQRAREKMRTELDLAWSHAERLSFAAGHDFVGRNGETIQVAQPCVVELAVQKYLEKTNWHWRKVNGWIQVYEDRTSRGGRQSAKRQRIQ